MNKNIPIITFISRTWMLFVFMLLSNWTVLSHHRFDCLGSWELNEQTGQWVNQSHTLFEYFGAILYVPPFASVILLVSLAFIHLFFRETIDKDAHDRTYILDWRACSPYQRVLVSNIVRIGFIIGFCILCSSLAKGAVIPVDQVSRWHSATINPKCSIALDVEVKLFERKKERYQHIQAMRKNGVPATVLFCLHYRESDNDFHCHAHEGSPLTHRTRDEPRGRLPHPEPPYTFEQSAEDAYYVCEHPPLDRIDWSDKQAALDKMESFNGFGYRPRGIAAPYLYSGTSLYRAGKYVRDGVFSASKIDGQLGCVAILKRMQQHGIVVSFDE